MHVHFQELGAVNGNPRPLAHNLSREDKVLEDLLVDVGEGAGTRPLLLNTGGTCGLAEHPALGNEDDMAVGELLLKLACQPVISPKIRIKRLISKPFRE